MKTYFLALNKSDFSIDNNVWTSTTIDLYSNKFYKNYSTYRSSAGENILGDYTFVGADGNPNQESTVSEDSTPTTLGEIILDQSQRKLFYI